MIEELASHVYKSLGSGHSERIYHNAMEVMLRKNNIQYETERIVPIVFEGHTIGNMRADLIVNNTTIVELKSVNKLTPGMRTQALNYLKLTGLRKALLINFPQCLSMDCEVVEVCI